MCFKGGMRLDKLYSLDLTKEEWNKIINLVLLEYNFSLAEKLQKDLLIKYPDFDFGMDWEECD